jgi:metal-dependent amidase/aminoacylase/carboxypeptidase family protein
VELMNVGVNYVREHMPSDARVHYALLDAGGIAPNVVQANAKVRYLIRAGNLPEFSRLIERVRKIADGAALMTETAVRAEVVSAVSNLLGNTPLEKAMHDNLQHLGPPPFDQADRDFARKIQATLTEEDIESAFRRAGMPIKDVPLCDEIVPLDAKRAPMLGSTDVGDVSWVVPTVQARGATYAIGTPGHSWQLTAQGKTAIRRAWGARPMSAHCQTNSIRRLRCLRRSEWALAPQHRCFAKASIAARINPDDETYGFWASSAASTPVPQPRSSIGRRRLRQITTKAEVLVHPCSML